jgi:hypothetical protein
MSKLLAVCHSIGDSQVIFESAKEMAKDQIETTILVIGSASRSKIQALVSGLPDSEKSKIAMLDLDEILPDLRPIQNNHLTLNETSLERLTDKVDVSQYSGLLIGTPSYVKASEQCDIPEQLLTQWGKTLQSAVVSDYAFFDPNHHLAKHRWFEKAKKFLLPFAKAKLAFGVDDKNSAVVGHPSIDAAKKLYQQWIRDRIEDKDPRILDVKSKLGIQDDQKFIFVAGGKADDEAMIKALAQTCKTHPEIQIFLGMHPAASQDYLSSLQEIINENTVEQQIKFMPKGAVTTDEAVYAADGVFTVSSTVGTTAGACGKLVAFYQEGKSSDDISIPYIVSDCSSAHFYSSNKELLTHYQRVKEGSSCIQEANVELETTAAQNIAKEMKLLMKCQ